SNAGGGIHFQHPPALHSHPPATQQLQAPRMLLAAAYTPDSDPRGDTLPRSGASVGTGSFTILDSQAYHHNKVSSSATASAAGVGVGGGNSITDSSNSTSSDPPPRQSGLLAQPIAQSGEGPSAQVLAAVKAEFAANPNAEITISSAGVVAVNVDVTPPKR